VLLLLYEANFIRIKQDTVPVYNFVCSCLISHVHL
jgi:hypothetical protein